MLLDAMLARTEYSSVDMGSIHGGGDLEEANRHLEAILVCATGPGTGRSRIPIATS
jgi:hypothetical protein